MSDAPRNHLTTLRQVIRLHQTLIRAANLDVSPRFAYAITFNRKLLDAHAEAHKELKARMPEAAKVYEYERNALIQGVAQRAGLGDAKDTVKIRLANVAAAAELKRLDEELKDKKEVFEKFEAEVAAALDAELPQPVILQTVSLDVMPEKMIASYMDEFYPMVADPKQ